MCIYNPKKTLTVKVRGLLFCVEFKVAILKELAVILKF